MSENINVEYQKQLDDLATELVNPNRFQQVEMTGWGGEVVVDRMFQKNLKVLSANLAVA